MLHDAINAMCVVGDSKTAKAELLMIGSGFCPHAVYNSGKVASDAGLTAADLRDGWGERRVYHQGKTGTFKYVVVMSLRRYLDRSDKVAMSHVMKENSTNEYSDLHT